MTKLNATSITVQFEGVRALNEVSLSMEAGQVFGLIGPNGAGKTTMFNALSGYVTPTQGDVELDGQRITNWSVEARARRGIGRSFQAVRLFEALSIQENIEVGALCRVGNRHDAHKVAEKLLDQFGLSKLADQDASNLPAGDRRIVGVLRALATNPKFLLLDEPAAGLNEQESDQLSESILRIREEFGCGVLIVDHDMRVIMPLCDKIQVLNYGETIAVGTPSEIRNSEAVVEAYLGAT